MLDDEEGLLRPEDVTEFAQATKLREYTKNIPIPEIEAELKEYAALHRQATSAKTSYDPSRLRDLSKEVMDEVCDILPHGFSPYNCLSNIAYEDLGTGEGYTFVENETTTPTLTIPGSPKRRPLPKIRIHSKYSNNLEGTASVLAHEVAHVRLYDPSRQEFDDGEWLDELVSYEALAKLARRKPENGFEKQFYAHQVNGAASLLSQKLQKERGMSGKDAAEYLVKEYDIHPEKAADISYRKDSALIEKYNVLPYAACRMLGQGKTPGSFNYSYQGSTYGLDARDMQKLLLPKK